MTWLMGKKGGSLVATCTYHHMYVPEWNNWFTIQNMDLYFRKSNTHVQNNCTQWELWRKSFLLIKLRNHYNLKRSGVSYTFSGEGPGALLNFEKYWHFGELWNISHILNEEQNCLFWVFFFIYFNNWCFFFYIF